MKLSILYNKECLFFIILSFLFFIQTIDAQLIINEFYANVALDISGDANGDGIRNAREDEFIELVNNSDSILFLEGYSIWISNSLRHQFNAISLAPKSAIVVFGGGTPVGNFGGGIISVASSGSLGLGNNGVEVEVRNPSGVVIEEFIYPATNPNASWNRFPDLQGAFHVHSEIPDAHHIIFSPGTLTNSFPFNSGKNTLVQFPFKKGTISENRDSFFLPIRLINPSDTATTIHLIAIDSTAGQADIDSFKTVDITFNPSESGQKSIAIPITDDVLVEGLELIQFILKEVSGGRNAQLSMNTSFLLTIEDNDFNFDLILNEIHADPANSIEGDANGDGVRDAKEDEFLEFVNISDEAIDISGFRIYDALALRHTIPEGTIIAPRQAYLLFGGGAPIGDFGGSVVQTASSGTLNLLNTGDEIILKDTNNLTVYAYAYGEEANNNQSITRFPDLEGESINTLHSMVNSTRLYSPGFKTDGTSFFTFSTSVNMQLDIDVKVFPNPITDYFYIDVPDNIIIKTIYLIDNLGRVKEIYFSNGKGLITSTTNGVYYLHIQTNKGWIKKCIVLQFRY